MSQDPVIWRTDDCQFHQIYTHGVQVMVDEIRLKLHLRESWKWRLIRHDFPKLFSNQKDPLEDGHDLKQLTTHNSSTDGLIATLSTSKHGLITMSPSRYVCRSLGHHWPCQMRRQMWPLNIGCDGEGGARKGGCNDRKGGAFILILFFQWWGRFSIWPTCWTGLKLVARFDLCIVHV